MKIGDKVSIAGTGITGIISGFGMGKNQVYDGPAPENTSVVTVKFDNDEEIKFDVEDIIII